MKISIPIIPLTSLLMLASANIGCASVGSTRNFTTTPNENEFSRTSLCVRGGLPMEIQFSLPDNPKKLGDSFNEADIDAIAIKVDRHIAHLISSAMLKAWTHSARYEEKWTRKFILMIENELNFEIAKQAPQALQLDFCGDPNQVGSQILVEIGEYFYRSVRRRASEEPLEWLREFGDAGPGNGRRIVMFPGRPQK